MDISIYFEEAAQVSFAFVIGAVLGLEREFRSKPAGFRTMILISVGSCLYTILSKEVIAGGADRIARRRVEQRKRGRRIGEVLVDRPCRRANRRSISKRDPPFLVESDRRDCAARVVDFDVQAALP